MQRKVLGSQVSLDKKGKDVVLEPVSAGNTKYSSKENVSVVRTAGIMISLHYANRASFEGKYQ